MDQPLIILQIGVENSEDFKYLLIRTESSEGRGDHSMDSHLKILMSQKDCQMDQFLIQQRELLITLKFDAYFQFLFIEFT